MSDKEKKDYDPTLLRAVGNILAGQEGLLAASPAMDYKYSIPNVMIERAVQVVLAAKKELKLQVEYEK